jgi:hypothetical protein
MRCCIAPLYQWFIRGWLFAASLLVCLGQEQTVVINEIQTSNGATLTDENGDAPDWVELFNPGTTAVDLTGWGLSDSTNSLFKWSFTNATLAPGGYMLVFASGKDRQPGAHPAVDPVTLTGLRVWLRADAVNVADTAQVRVSGTTTFVKSWRDQSGHSIHAGQLADANQPVYVPSAPGVGGGPALRFDGANDLLVLSSVPAQNNFCVIAVARPTAGHEVDAQGPGGVGGVSGQRYLFGAQHGGDFNSGAGLSLGTNGATVYEHGSGYMPALAVVAAPILNLAVVSFNYSNRQPTLAVQSTLGAVGAASTRNVVNAPVEIGTGAYGSFAGEVAEILVFDRTLTELELKGIEEFLRQKYQLTFPQIRHTNFTLDKNGEKIFLTRPNGLLADWLPSVEVPRDVSWGRQADGTTNWFFFATPTPGAPNTTLGATDFLNKVKFSTPAGFYTTNLTVALLTTNHPAGTQIRYTTDGSEPSATSPLYIGPLTLGPRAGTPNNISSIPTAGGWQAPLGEVFKLHVIRARAFRTNSLPSEVNTASFCVDARGRGRYSLPVISLASERANFFDANRGIYVCGNTPGCNYAQSGDLWERPCHVEFFETNGTRAFAQESGVRMHGNTSFGFPIKALRLHPLNQKGSGPFEHRIFPDLNIDKFYRLLLRPSGHDYYLTMMRDGLMQGLMRETGIDMQAYRPAILFLNGEYWGIHNLQEAFDEHYFSTHYPAVSEDAVDYIEGYAPSAAANNGDATHYHNLMAFMTANSLTNASNYAWVQTQMEVDNYIDYKVSETFYYRWDIGNHRLWRPHTATGRWRWIIFDQDVGYGGFWSVPPAWQFPMLAYNLEPAGPWTQYQQNPGGNDHNHPVLTVQLRTLLTNPDFKRAFLNRFADLMNSTLSAGRMTAFIQRMAAEISPEMVEHTRRWRAPADWPTWTNNVAALHQFATNRGGFQRQQIVTQFALRGTATATLQVNDPTAGQIRWSTLWLSPSTNAPWTGTYFRDIPVTFSAQPYNGYRFKQWVGLLGSSSTNLTNTLAMAGNVTLRAVFEALSETPPVPSAHPLASGPYQLARWDSNAPAGAFPPHMLFTQTATNALPDPGLIAEFTNVWTLPYDRVSRSRVFGLGEDGVGFVNTSDPQLDGGGYVGAAVLALDTRGSADVQVAWRGGTVSANNRAYAIGLQFRVGTTNAFTDLLDAHGQPVTYFRSAVSGQHALLGPVSLPASCREQPYVQLRWKYYHVSGTSGTRDALRLDDIVVSGGTLLPGPSHLSLAGPGVFRLEATGAAGLDYTVQVSTNLVDWSETTRIRASASGELRWESGIAPQAPVRFYRLQWP